MMKVCLMNDSFPPVIDGVANAVLNYARVITARRGECVVVTPEYPGARYDYPFPVITYPSLDTTRTFGYRTGLPLEPRLMLRLKQEDFSLIHSHCPMISTLLARSLRITANVPVVFTYHTKYDIDIANALKGEFLQEAAVRMLAANAEACDEVWVVSRGAGENLRHLGYTGEYRVMENGVDLPRGAVSPEAAAEAAAGFDLPAGVPVYLFVGRLMWYKGIRLILEGLAGLLTAGKDFRMVFVGGGGDEEEIRALAEQLGLGKNCVFTGPVLDREKLRGWYSRADLLLFPSTFDTNGLVVREAAACGLPALLIRDSCAAEGVTDGVNGVLIREDSAALFAALNSLYGREEVLGQIGQRAMDDLYLSWEDSVLRAWDRYEEILADWHGRKRLAPTKEEFTAVYGIQNILEEMRARMREQLGARRNPGETDRSPKDKGGRR